MPPTPGWETVSLPPRSLRQGDHLGQRPRREVGAGQQQQRRVLRHGDRRRSRAAGRACEVRLISGAIRVESEAYISVVPSGADRATWLSRDQGGRAGPVLHDEGGALHALVQLAGDQARHDVVGAAGGEADDDADLPRRQVMRRCAARYRRQRQGRPRQRKPSSDSAHPGPPVPLLLVGKASRIARP